VNPNGSADGLVIGGPNAANNRYNTALSSNGNGDRYIIGSGAAYSSGQPFFGLNTLPSWTISVGNVDISNLKISNVIFGFGESSTTDYGWNSITVPADTPEPGSVILFTTGLGLMALGARKRLLRRS
jgi:hypothetical protein